MALITISDIETRLNKTITGTSDEDLYSYLITAIQDRLEKICNRKFEEAEYTDRLNGNGQFEILLPEYPVSSITSIQIIDTDGTVLETLDSNYYHLVNDTGSVYYSGKFPVGYYNIKVVYTAGYSSNPSDSNYLIPDDLKNTLIEMIEEVKNKSFTDAEMQSETLGDYSYTKGAVEQTMRNNTYKLRLYMKYD